VKVLGIVGGIGPESTIEYYRSIIREYRLAVADGASPALVISSIDVRVLLDLIGKRLYPETVKYLGNAILSLAGAGADFAILAANTPHIVFDDLRKVSPIPLLSIVDATCQAAKALRMTKVGLIGTRFTMQADFYQRPFSVAGINLVVPKREEQDVIHEIYVGELLNGKFLPSSRGKLCQILGRLKRDDQIQGVVLAGTELPLLLGEIREVEGIPLLDTTQIHANAAVAEMLG
jgi:aspartate racemase